MTVNNEKDIQIKFLQESVNALATRLEHVEWYRDQLLQTLDEVKIWYEYESQQGGDNPWWYNKKLRELKETLRIDDS